MVVSLIGLCPLKIFEFFSIGVAVDYVFFFSVYYGINLSQHVLKNFQLKVMDEKA